MQGIIYGTLKAPDQELGNDGIANHPQAPHSVFLIARSRIRSLPPELSAVVSLGRR